MIGCYYFADAARLRRCLEDSGAIHISDVVRSYLEAGLKVVSAPTERAHFFGDPARLARVAALP